jgi:hypothetical protein
MRRLKIDGWRDTPLQGITPSSNAQAPAVSRFQPRESPFWMRSNKVVAIEDGEIEEVARDFNANRMQPGVFRTGTTESVAVETG